MGDFKPEDPLNHRQVKLSDSQFSRVSRYISDHLGIELKPVKKSLVESRLQKRLRTRQIGDFKEYLNLVLTPGRDPVEHVEFIDSITTNKTDFFREKDHFDFLRTYLRDLAKQNRRDKKLRIWSAACSTGEEPYTLAMVLEELKRDSVVIDYEIIATDISQRALRAAVQAEYDVSRIQSIPHHMRRKYLLKHKNKTVPKVKFTKAIRDKVTIQPFNLRSNYWNNLGTFDHIFCRNTFIYFNMDTQREISARFLQRLHPLGFLFLGHSETLNGSDLPVKQVHPSVYQSV